MEDESSGYTIRQNILLDDQRMSFVVSWRRDADALRNGVGACRFFSSNERSCDGLFPKEAGVCGRDERSALSCKRFVKR